jgi:hypothetical protein
MMSRYDQYTNEWGDAATLNDGEKGLVVWRLDAPDAYKTDSRLPDAVRRLKPGHIIVGTNYVFICLMEPARTRVLAFADDTSTTIRGFSGEGLCLTNGLWFYR